MDKVVVEWEGKKYIVPRKIVVEAIEHSGRCDGCSYYTDGREFWGRHWTNSNALDICGCCGQLYTGFKNCGCEDDYFEITKEEFMREAMKQGLAEEISMTLGEAYELKRVIEDIEEKVNSILEKLRQIKEFTPL